MPCFAAVVIGIKYKALLIQSLKQNGLGRWPPLFVHGGKAAGIGVIEFGIHRLVHPGLKLIQRIGGKF